LAFNGLVFVLGTADWQNYSKEINYFIFSHSSGGLEKHTTSRMWHCITWLIRRTNDFHRLSLFATWQRGWPLFV